MKPIMDYEIIGTDSKFFTGLRADCLRICLDQINKSRKIGAKKLTAIENSFCLSKRGKLSENKKIILHDVLNRLNELGISDSVLPITAQRPFRPSLQPKTGDEFIQSATCHQIVNYFWDEWLGEQLKTAKYKEEIFSFAFALSAVSQSGIGKLIVHDLITNLTSNEIDDDLTIRTKIHPKDNSENYSILSLAAPTQFILASWLKKEKTRDSKYLFLPTSIRSRKQHVLKMLNDNYTSLIADFCTKKNEQCPKSWSVFANLASVMPVFDQKIGLEPYFHTVQSGYPLPVSHPVESDFSILLGNENSYPSSMISRKSAENHSKKQLLTTYFEPESIKKTDDNDWTGKSKSILRSLNRKISSVVKEHQNIAAEGITRKVLLLIDQAKKEANSLTTNKSALHLALEWIRHKIIQDKIKASTVRGYLNRVFTNGLLTDPDSIDFSTWESEDHESIFEDIISRDSIKSEKTRLSIVIPYKQAYRFGNDHGFFSNVDISYISDEWCGGTTRNELVGLSEFDAFIRIILENDKSAYSKMTAVVCILAFYGGMRAGEISRLALNDIEISDGYLFVDIHKGKSAAARRRIPLYLIAPRYACDIISNYFQFRREQFRKDAHLTDIPLFGLTGKRERYTRHSLADVAIGFLQQYFGDSITLHSLRHAACSWLLVRIYCCRYPAAIAGLKDRNHEVFSPEYITYAVYLFSGEELNQIPDYCGSSLIRLCKLIGHLGPRTMFSTYIHTFHLIQRHAMERISAVYGERTLNGKTIAALVPKMQSKTSQARLKNKSINGILEKVFKI